MALGALAACGLVERKRTARKAQAQFAQLGQLDPALSHALPKWDPSCGRPVFERIVMEQMI